MNKMPDDRLTEVFQLYADVVKDHPAPWTTGTYTGDCGERTETVRDDVLVSFASPFGVDGDKGEDIVALISCIPELFAHIEALESDIYMMECDLDEMDGP